MGFSCLPRTSNMQARPGQPGSATAAYSAAAALAAILDSFGGPINTAGWSRLASSSTSVNCADTSTSGYGIPRQEPAPSMPFHRRSFQSKQMPSSISNTLGSTHQGIPTASNMPLMHTMHDGFSPASASHSADSLLPVFDMPLSSRVPSDLPIWSLDNIMFQSSPDTANVPITAASDAHATYMHPRQVYQAQAPIVSTQQNPPRQAHALSQVQSQHFTAQLEHQTPWQLDEPTQMLTQTGYTANEVQWEGNEQQLSIFGPSMSSACSTGADIAIQSAGLPADTHAPPAVKKKKGKQHGLQHLPCGLSWTEPVTSEGVLSQISLHTASITQHEMRSCTLPYSM